MVSTLPVPHTSVGAWNALSFFSNSLWMDCVPQMKRTLATPYPNSSIYRLLRLTKAH